MAAPQVAEVSGTVDTGCIAALTIGIAARPV